MLRALGRAAASPPHCWLLAVATAGCIASAMLPPQASLSALCGSLGRVPLADWPMLMGPVWSPIGLSLAWLVMLTAMMPPLLAEPVRHVWHASMPVRRAWAVLLCALGYVLLWMLAGVILVPTALRMSASVPDGTAAAVSLGLALLWSASPSAQQARNRCHRTLRVGAHGRRADLECLIYGMNVGSACVWLCWPWMLVPMMSETGHVAAMVGVGLWLLLDRLFPPRRPGWRLPPALGELIWRFRTSSASRSSALR